jgi:hypothetical protein
VNPTDAATMMLLIAHFLALGVAVMVFLWMIFLQRRNRTVTEHHGSADGFSTRHLPTGRRPNTWLAIRSLQPEAVRTVLADEEQFIISPRVNGWVIITGPGLPQPDEDVDGCFRFLTGLSRQLGHVQFFYREKYSLHHAWARMDEGCVTRAYAWVGETVWNQGTQTLVEKQLGMQCPDYGEEFESGGWTRNEPAAANVDKIPRLAARWSIDPEILQRSSGMAGESSRFY